MHCVSVVLIFIVATMASASEDKTYFDVANALTYFEEFKTKHNKSYADKKEEQYRYRVFVENLEKINKLNKESTSASFGINKYADITPEEMKSMHGFGKPK